jgi:hypothetical protein
MRSTHAAGVPLDKQWNGPNKQRAREEKLALTTPSAESQSISLPGSNPVFEKALIGRGMPRGEIAGVQKAGIFRFYDGRVVLRELIKRMDIPVFILDFVHLPEVLSNRVTQSLLVAYEQSRKLPEKNSFGRWVRDREPHFDILDLDFCSPFRPEIAQAVINMFVVGAVAEEGVLFINHMKGMEKAGHLDDVGGKGGIRTRYGAIPWYYIMHVRTTGYDLQPMKVVEYRDAVAKAHKSATMIQYLFRFKRGDGDLTQHHQFLRHLMGEALYAEGEPRHESETYLKITN